MAENRIEVEIVLDDGSIQKGFGNIAKKGKKHGEDAGKNFGAGFAKAAGAAIAVAAAATVAFLKKAIDAAIIQEQAITDLNTALKNAGSFSDEASESFQKMAAEIERTTKFGDELILSQTALARNFVKTNEEAENLVKAAVDLSAATGLTLDSSIKNLGKTLSGLAGELGESVPLIRTLTVEQLKAGEAVTLLGKAFKGTAAAQVKTFGGAIAQTSNAFGTLLENVGLVITRSPAVIEVITQTTKKFNELAKAVQEAFPDTFASETTRLRIELKGLLETQTNLEKEMQASKDANLLAADAYGILESKLARVNERIADFPARFKAARASIQDAAADTTATDTLKKSLDEALGVTTTGQLGVLSQQFSERNQVLLTAREQDLIGEEQFQMASLQLQENFAKAQQDLLIKSGDSRAKISKVIGDTVNSGLTAGVSQGISSIGAALVKGEDAFGAFAGSILSILGDMMIQIGTAIILESKAVEALRNSLTTLFGAPGIVAGLALVAFGGALKAFGGGGGVSAGSSGGGGVTGGGTTETVAAEIDEPDEERERSTAVTVNLHGVITDPEATAILIAELLSEQEDKIDIRVNA